MTQLIDVAGSGMVAVVRWDRQSDEAFLTSRTWRAATADFGVNMEPALTDRDLLTAYRAGDENAAFQLFERYYRRLYDLAGRSLGWKLRKVEAPSDVAQSALRTVFRRSQTGEIELGSNENLWAYLASVTLNKIRNRARYWSRQRRDAARDVPLGDARDPLESGPSPEDAAILKETVDKLLEPFSDRRRQILTMFIEGHTPGEIAMAVGTTQRTVYNTRIAAGQFLAKLLAQGDPRS